LGGFSINLSRCHRVQVADVQNLRGSGEREDAVDRLWTPRHQEWASGPPSADIGKHDDLDPGGIDEGELP
jgi:hypothetical protein